MPTIAIDLAKVRQEVANLDTEVVQLTQAIQSKQGRARDLRDLISIAERLYGDSPSGGPEVPEAAEQSQGLPGSLAHLTAEAAALWVLQSGGVWSPRDIARVMQERGWATTSDSPEAIVSGALVRLMKARPDEVVKQGYGKYQFRSDVMDRLAKNGHQGVVSALERNSQAVTGEGDA